MNYFSANRTVFGVLSVIAFLTVFYYFFFNAPANFPVGTIINIEEGKSLRGVSFQLKENHIIRSRIVFEAFMVLFGGERHVIPADYLLEEKLHVFEIAKRISKGERHLAPIKITIPEGLNVVEMAQIFDSKLPDFDLEKFLKLAQPLEGYLFPDTYFFFTTDGEKEVIKSMGENFDKKIKSILSDIAKTGSTEKEIIIMASLIEGEAKGESDRSFISGILWKRLKMNMPLQVDVALETYEARGLPKDPIGSPGMEAIKSAVFPKNSNYLYYLHDKDGNVHYARTFSEHKQNILKYLK